MKKIYKILKKIIKYIILSLYNFNQIFETEHISQIAIHFQQDLRNIDQYKTHFFQFLSFLKPFSGLPHLSEAICWKGEQLKRK